MKPIRVCLADDHSLFRQGLKLLMNVDPRVEVVGEVANTNDLQQVIATTLPEILLLDLTMPGDDGFEKTIRSLRQNWPALKIIVLTMHDDLEYTKAALLAGATSYLTKGIAESELISSIVAVSEGRSVLNLRADVPLHEILSISHRPQLGVPAPHVSGLSSRETEVIKLVAQGFTSAQIADRLFLSTKTIDTYRSRLMTKLGFKSRAELVQYATSQGWLEEAPL